MRNSIKKLYVFRCSDGCVGICASMDRSEMVKMKVLHKKLLNHKGTVTLEDKVLVVESDG